MHPPQYAHGRKGVPAADVKRSSRFLEGQHQAKFYHDGYENTENGAGHGAVKRVAREQLGRDPQSWRGNSGRISVAPLASSISMDTQQSMEIESASLSPVTSLAQLALRNKWSPAGEEGTPVPASSWLRTKSMSDSGWDEHGSDAVRVVRAVDAPMSTGPLHASNVSDIEERASCWPSAAPSPQAHDGTGDNGATSPQRGSIGDYQVTSGSVPCCRVHNKRPSPEPVVDDRAHGEQSWTTSSRSVRARRKVRHACELPVYGLAAPNTSSPPVSIPKPRELTGICACCTTSGKPSDKVSDEDGATFIIDGCGHEVCRAHIRAAVRVYVDHRSKDGLGAVVCPMSHSTKNSDMKGCMSIISDKLIQDSLSTKAFEEYLMLDVDVYESRALADAFRTPPRNRTSHAVISKTPHGLLKSLPMGGRCPNSFCAFTYQATVEIANIARVREGKAPLVVFRNQGDTQLASETQNLRSAQGGHEKDMSDDSLEGGAVASSAIFTSPRTVRLGLEGRDAFATPVSCRRASSVEDSYRYRCKDCEVDFCALCRTYPYHSGFTCSGWREYTTQEVCRYCKRTLDDKNRAPDAEMFDEAYHSVCDEEFCMEARRSSCSHRLPCGHYCSGVCGERPSPPPDACCLSELAGEKPCLARLCSPKKLESAIRAVFYPGAEAEPLSDASSAAGAAAGASSYAGHDATDGTSAPWRTQGVAPICAVCLPWIALALPDGYARLEQVGLPARLKRMLSRSKKDPLPRYKRPELGRLYGWTFMDEPHTAKHATCPPCLHPSCQARNRAIARGIALFRSSLADLLQLRQQSSRPMARLASACMSSMRIMAKPLRFMKLMKDADGKHNSSAFGGRDFTCERNMIAILLGLTTANARAIVLNDKTRRVVEGTGSSSSKVSESGISAQSHVESGLSRALDVFSAPIITGDITHVDRMDTGASVPRLPISMLAIHTYNATTTTYFNVDGLDHCSICFAGRLHQSPCIQLECGHSFHYDCVREKLELRWTTPYISLGFMSCTLCRKPIRHPLLEDLVKPLNALIMRLRDKVSQRLTFENRLQDIELTSPNSPTYNDPLAYGLSQYTYYECTKCSEPFYGGLRECGEAPVVANEQYGDRVCPSCVDDRNCSGETVCAIHGKEYIEYKCRFCCKSTLT